MSTTAEKTESLKEKPLSFSERYAIPYYISTIQVLVSYWLMKHFDGNPSPSFAFYNMLPMLGMFFHGDDYPVTNFKELLLSKWHVVPMLTNVIAVWIHLIDVIINYPISNYTWGQTAQLYYVLGILILNGNAVTHELIHHPNRLLHLLSYFQASLLLYSIYPIVHLYSHHKHVGTVKDHITSPKGQDSFTFGIKNYFKGHIFACKRDMVSFFGCLLVDAAYLGGVYFLALHKTGSPEHALRVLGFFMLLSWGSFIMFQVVEYLEHYGLVYDASLDKNYIREVSSWNCNRNQVHNWMAYRVQRHADHHLNAYKNYPTLELTEKMPMLPVSKGDAFIVAAIPPLWFYIMHPFLDEVMGKGKVSDSHKFIADITGRGVMWFFIAISALAIYTM